MQPPALLPERFDALLVANGTPPAAKLLRELAGRTFCLIALDGGIAALYRAALVPDHVVGDLDSATPRALVWAKRHGAQIHHVPAPDRPDIAKGFELCRRLKHKRVLVTGLAGERLDHVLAALQFAGSARGMEVVIVTREMVAFFLRGRAAKSLTIPRGHSLSWFGVPLARGCTVSGVRWPFTNRTLTAGGFHSLSNEPVSEEVVFAQRSGCSLVMISCR